MSDWKQAIFYLPPVDVQNDVLDVLDDIQVMEAGLEAARRSIWAKLPNTEVARSHLRGISPARSRRQWIETLPFPLASVLWVASAKKRPTAERALELLNFFEAVAQFTATVLLAGFMNESRSFKEAKSGILRSLKRQGLTYRRATFGTWVLVAGYFAKRLREDLNSGDNIRQRIAAAFNVRTAKILELLCSSSVIGLLQRANSIRNRLSHGGLRLAGDLCRVLDQMVGNYQESCGELWELWHLIVPDLSRLKGDVHHHQAKLAVGVSSHFEEVEVPLKAAAQAEKLHLYDAASDTALALLPFVQLKKSATATEDICYFYSGMKGEDIRFVSYYSASDAELIEADDEVSSLVEDLMKSDND